MKKISGDSFFVKILFPGLWFVFLALIALVGAVKESSLGHLFTLFFMAVFGFLFFKKMVWSLTDEVYDEGGSLLFRKGDREQRVHFEDIIHISHSKVNSSERIKLHVRTGGAIGKELVFMAPVKIFDISEGFVSAGLIDRMGRAKRAG